MATRVTTERALAVIDTQQREWEELVIQVGPDRAERPGPGGDWTFKDLAGHITDWENREMDCLDDPQAKAPWGEGIEIDEINAWIYRRNADRPLGDVLRDADLVYERLRGIVSGLSEADLNDPERFPDLDGLSLGQALVEGEYFDHITGEHGKEIEAWRSVG